MKRSAQLYLAGVVLIALSLLGAWLFLADKSASKASDTKSDHVSAIEQSGVPNQSQPSRQTASQANRPQSLDFMVRQASTVRLFIEGVPFKEPVSTQKLIDNVKGISLTDGQRAILGQSIHKKRATEEDLSSLPGCFIPHHFFRFYDEEGVAFAELSVCYCCGGARLEGPAAAKIMGDADFIEFDYAAVKKMLLSMKVPTDINCSKSARF
ncbi:hypothetical protein V6U71_07040 [Sphingopyxis sp. J-6]|uniref:hypothetical protein n=1 Tax=Sphingopyxis sp. J-6 TaxID=3122054 RepID=UPI00398416DB